ncbi:hypothetical protein K8I61_13965 [bacterium]|nr:hypothetical protein [bacterium]
MSLLATPCHPEATSLVTLAQAGEYMQAHPDRALWDDVPGDTDTEKDAAREALLSAASRMVSRAPLRHGPLSEALGWPIRQAFDLPVAGHPVHRGVAVEVNGDTLAVPSFAGLAIAVGGALRFADGTILHITAFDAATGEIAVEGTFDITLPSPVWAIAPLSRLARDAVCEQAAFLARGPNLALLDDAARASMRRDAGRAGGTLALREPMPSAELGFAARRLLARAGLINAGRAVESGRA